MKRILFLASFLGAAVWSGASFSYDTYTTAPVPENAPSVQGAAPIHESSYAIGSYVEEAEADKLISGSFVGGWADGFWNEGNNWSLTQAWLTSEKTVDPNKGGLDLGYRVDALFGTNILQSEDGLDYKWGVSGDGYGASLFQAYGQLGWGKLSLKGGKFGTTLGYESVDESTDDFNTHTHMFDHEPTSHTGGLFTYQLTEAFYLDFGMVSGINNSFSNRRGDSGFLFGAGWQIAENVEVTYAGVLSQVHSILGENRAATSYGYYDDLFGVPVGDNNEYLQTVAATIGLSDRLSYAIASNYGTMSDRATRDPRYGQFGVANYLSYALTDRLTLAARYEYYTQWLKDAGKQPGAAGDMEQRCHDVSFGMVYRPIESFFIRPEARYDWIETGDFKNNATGTEDGFTGSVSCGFVF